MNKLMNSKLEQIKVTATNSAEAFNKLRKTVARVNTLYN